ncbi:MAG: sensor histidine kinase, partial [Alistipes sp.]|nr:sensor histidine kinase [Alistipes sp.]
MVSAIKLSFHKRLFLQLIAYSWAIVLCFIGFQYLHEKEYKSKSLSAQLQQYNLHLLVAIEEGTPYDEYVATHEKPFDDLRISIMTHSGQVVYDNIVPLDSLDNHSTRPEVAAALRNGA